ncbi:MAG: M56 family metallopeptidase [Planctomycetota bacterium]|jgi:beta-lactamase regulating signal transducer with metallopeptidase domain
MNAMVEQINATGKAFVEFTTPMLIQSGVLILILLGLDLILRKKVRAVVRYWMWMLVLLKLVLPTTLSLPTGLGYWFGDRLPEIAVEKAFVGQESELKPAAPVVEASETVTVERPVITASSPIDAAPRPTRAAPAKSEPASSARIRAPAMTWQGLVFLTWLAVAAAMGLLLLQRALFVRGLVAQAKEAKGLMNDAFKLCRQQLNSGRKVTLKISPTATSPAVCGLFRPVILVPRNLSARLGARDLRAVFLHELAHIKRGDLWVNLIQTLLQIAYFYNPLLWRANTIIRRVREQAVDEMVLVAMGEKARWYPETLVNVAKLAFERPALSLRLIGVVESKDALAARIRRILNQPIPKRAGLGALGLVLVFVIGAVLLPMAKAQKHPGQDSAVVLDSDKDGLENQLEAELGTNVKAEDTDGDGLSDYNEYCKYRTDPTKKDSDADGKPDGDWQERREYTYTIRALCQIRSPSGLEMINDLYQDARRVDRKALLEDAVVVEVLLFPFAAPHVYAQPYPKESVDKALRKYIRPTVSMNFSSEMEEQVGNIVEGADTDVQAIEKMLRWINTETELKRYNPHWDYFHIVNDEIVWHGSHGDPSRNKRFLETNFFADSMFKNKVHGTCSSTAILRGAMFRAVGLPTRLIQTLPLVTRYCEDPEPLADSLRMRAMAKGYEWGPGTGGANHMYNEVFLNNHWIRVDNSIGTGPFVGDKLFVKAWSSASLNNIKEEWNNRRCFRALDVSDAYPKYKSEATRPDIAIQNRDLTVRKLPDGQFKASIMIHNNGQEPTPRLRVLFYAGDPKRGGRKVHPGHHRAGPIMPGAAWGESTHPFILRESENEIFVVVDPDNMVDEADETNNKASTGVGGIAPKKVGDLDIAVEHFKIVFHEKYNAYYVVASIRNKGKDASPQFPVYFYVGDPDAVEPITHAAGPVKPGGVWNERSGNFGLREGANLISVAVDPHNTFAESDETNNRASLSVFIEAGRIVEKSVSYSLPEAEESGPCPEHTKVEGGVSPPARQRHFVRLVVGPARMTFEGQQVTWEDLPKLLGKVPQHSNTVLTVAVASDDMTLAQKNQATGRAGALAKEFGFDHLSYIGVHPLGSKAGPEAEPAKKVERVARKAINSIGKKHKSIEEFIAPFASGAQLAVRGINGSINVSAAADPECRIKATIKVETKNKEETRKLRDKVKIDVRQVAENLSVEVQQPKLRRKQSVTVDFEITLPPQASLDLHTNNGSIDIADISGDIQSRTNNGSLSAVRTAGNTRLRTNNGRINITKAALAPGAISANNGSITCKEISGDLQAGLNNGRVKVSYAKTAPSVCSVSVTVNNGDIDFTAPPNFSAVVEAGTRIGSIKTDLPLTVKGWLGKTVSGTLGKGEGKLHLETSNGSIRIR